jgi:hypothetical protein
VVVSPAPEPYHTDLDVRKIVHNLRKLGKEGCLMRHGLDEPSRDERVRVFVYVVEWHSDEQRHSKVA